MKALSKLKANPRNPRLPWEAEQASNFKRSLEEFGDLSGIVTNVRTGQLVGGHKRVAEFRSAHRTQIVITDKLSKPDSVGTVAWGYVFVEGRGQQKTGVERSAKERNGTRWAYREVDWPAKKEAAANIAANQWGAEWDLAEVGDILKSLSKADLALTGFNSEELDSLLKEVSAPTEFNKFDENLPVEHKCPKCGYEWSGKPA